MLSNKYWKPEAVLRLALGVFLCLFFGMILMAGMRQIGGGNFDDSPWRAVLAALSFQGLALVLVQLFVWEHQLSWAGAFGFSNNWKVAVLVGAVICIVFLPIGWGLQIVSIEVMSHFSVQPNQQEAVQALGQVKGWTDCIALAGVAVVLAPIAEEILFRGILYTFIKQVGYPKLALWGTSVLFATIHWNLMTLVPLLVLAITLTLLYEKTDNLLAPIAMHSLFNAVNFLAFYFGDRFNHLFPQHP
jgi:CAAX protease family protein